MKKLKNWDNKTWLSSKSYISKFNKFIKTKINLNKDSKILDIGCGRANIISALQKKYKFREKPIGVDIVKNQDIKKNITFKKIDGFNFLKKNKLKYDLIILKQTLHFFPNNKINFLLNLAKRNLNINGKLLIFSLKTRNNNIPCFKKMRTKLKDSLKRDEKIFKIIKRNFKTKSSYFNFQVTISKQKYFKMIRSRYISCLLNLSNQEILDGLNEIKFKYNDKIKFIDSLVCFTIQRIY